MSIPQDEFNPLEVREIANSVLQMMLEDGNDDKVDSQFPAEMARDLIGNIDAMEWADAFCELNPGSDHSLMVTWFANAIMTGYDSGLTQGQGK